LYARYVNRNFKPADSITGIIHDEYLNMISGSHEIKADWSAFKNAVERNEYYLLIRSNYREGYLYQIIPKRAFESPEHEVAFRALVEKHLGPIKR
jgi:hypothetical protein